MTNPTPQLPTMKLYKVPSSESQPQVDEEEEEEESARRVMEDQSTPVSFVDPYKHMNLVQNPDGTITRNPLEPEVPATGDTSDSDVLTKDVPINESNATAVRIYRPSNATKDSKLPLIIYYHGGGFILFTTASLAFHDLCVRMARELPAVIVSVNYRLAPEHRLPAAYEDAVEAVLWVKDQSNGEPWLKDYVNFSNCFIMGSSAGGNMVYNAALRLRSLGSEQLQPLKINGLILNQPFFGSVKRTSSELKQINNPILPLPSADLMWEFSLPTGASRDHEYCNPMMKGLSKWEIEALNSQKCLVTVGGEDLLFDTQKEFMKMLEDSGVKFVSYYDEKGYHAFEVVEPEKCRGLFKAIRDFIH